MGKILCKNLISHRRTKAFTVHTSTSLQLKANTSPKPSIPCYYGDIFNLSLPMTGLVIMFPVLFQLQITANSVIRGLLWPLCQPSSGPLTVCWPGASLLEALICRDLWAQTAFKNYSGLQLSIRVSKSLMRWVISSLLWFFTSSAYLFVTTDILSKQVIMAVLTCFSGHLTLEPSPIVLTWSSSTFLLGLKGSVLTLTACPAPALCLTTCLVVKHGALCLAMGECNIRGRKTVISFLLCVTYRVGIMEDCCKNWKMFWSFVLPHIYITRQLR